MEYGRWHGVKNFVRSIIDYFTKNSYTIDQQPPIHVKEGSHRVLIKFQDNKNDDRLYEYDVDFSVIEDSKGLLGCCFASYEDSVEIRELREKKAQFENLLAEREIAASYVHEIKNPIFSIRGFLQILQQSFNDDDKRKEYTNIMINELDRMNNLLNEFLSKYRDLLTIEDKYENGVSIKKTINEIINFFKYGLELKGISYEVELGDDELYVLIDKAQLMQIFINLIQNSIESMISGGHLSIKAYEKDERVFIEIKDEGVGIKQDEMDKIFSPFFSTKENGTGLGLYITKKIIDNNGGSISMESTEGKGTTSYLTFPIKD